MSEESAVTLVETPGPNAAASSAKATGTAVLVLDGAGTRVLRANADAAALLGYSLDELLALPPGRLLAGPGDPGVWGAASGVVALRHRSDRPVVCRAGVGRLPMPEGERLVVTLDPSEADADARLDALLRIAIDQLSDALVIYDTEDRLLYFNSAYRELYPYMPPFEALKGQHFFEVIRHSMQAPGVVVDPLARENPQAYMEKRLKRLHEADGEPFEQHTADRWHLVLEQRVPGVGFVGVRHDITEMKRLHDRMSDANAMLAEAREAAEIARYKAENANRSKSEFLAMMSHELRTPLNAILGFSSLLVDEYQGPLNDKYKDYAQSIHDSGAHLLAIINDILDLAKVEAGRMEIEPEPLEFRDLANECLSLMRGLAEARALELRCDCGTPGMTVYADRRAAKQMLVNLLSNACKFTPSGGQVILSVERRSGLALVRVRDTGIGMSAADLAIAMEPFGQVGDVSTSARQGTGLGLPLVKSFAELHGGTMEIESAPGEGTTVTLAFPDAGVASLPAKAG